MNEKKGWLEKVLNDASADVKSWPNWLRDDSPVEEGQEPQEASSRIATANCNGGTQRFD